MVDSRRRELDDSLLDLIRAVVAPGDEIYTLTTKRPSRIVSIHRAGIEVETIRSEDRGSGPQLVRLSGWREEPATQQRTSQSESLWPQ